MTDQAKLIGGTIVLVISGVIGFTLDKLFGPPVKSTEAFFDR